MKVVMKCVNIKHWDILGCFHYILNASRICQLAVISFEKKSVHVCVIALCRKNQDILTRVYFFVSSINIILRHAVEIIFSISFNQKSFHYGKCRYFISFHVRYCKH